MNADITHPAQSVPHSPTLEIVTPLAARTLFWRARYLKKSSFLHHLPFLFWLIETCRPTSIVELGVGDGVSYFAACQAVDKLGLDAYCQGIDRWEEKDANLDAVREHNAEQYGNFSRLIAGDVHEVVRRFSDGSIDLLHVDVEVEGSVLDSLSHDWTRKLSPHGVILLHGVTTRFTEGHAKAFLSNLAASYPHVLLEGGDGLVAILYGSERNDRLSKLANLKFGMSGYSEVHQVFSRLGATHHFEWASRFEAGEARTFRENLEIAEELREEADARSTRLEEKLGSLDNAYNARTAQMAELHAKIFDLQSAHEARETELVSELAATRESLDANRGEIKVLRTSLEETETHQAEALASRNAALAEAHRKLEAQDAEITRLEEQNNTRFEEFAVLTRMLEDKDEELRQLQQELASVLAHRAELLNSTSWKVMAPARAAISAFRR